MTNKYHSCNAASFVINIDSCDSGVLSGRFCCVQQGTSVGFSCLAQLVLNIDRIMDELEGPQSFQKIRTMTSVYLIDADTSQEVHPQRGDLATFALHVVFRRNASWQGSVSWLEEDIEQNFRSVLELLTLVNSAVLQKKQELWNDHKVAIAE